MMLLLCLLLLPFLLCLLFQRRFERVVAPYLCGLMLGLYPFALAGRMNAFPWLVYGATAVALGLAAASLARGKIRLSSWPRLALTPGLVCFALLAAFLWLGTRERMVWWGDEIRYWAIAPKSLYQLGGLTDGARCLWPDFASYTPGMPLLQWLAITLAGEWSEGLLYFALFLFEAAFLMPFAEKLTWRKAYWSPLFLLLLVGFPAMLNGFTYYTLSVDTALGLCFGYALCGLWMLREDASAPRLAAIALSLCALVLIKQAGLALLLMALAFLPVCLKGARVKPASLAAVFAAPLALFLSWFVFCRVAGLRGMHTSALPEQLGGMLTGTWQPPQGWENMLPGLWRAMLSDLSHYPMYKARAPLEVPMLYRMVLLCAAPLALIPLARQHARALRRLSLWALAACAVEVIAVAFAFATAFYNEVGEYVSGGRNLLPLLLERYFCPVLFGLGMLLIAIVQGVKLRRTRSAVLGLVSAALLLTLGNWHSIEQYMLADVYLAREHDAFAAYLEEENFWTGDLNCPQRAVVLLGTGETQSEPEKWQYALAPVKIVFPPAAGVDDLPTLLAKMGVTHIVTLDDSNAVYEAALPYEPYGEIYTYTVYTVLWEDGGLSLLEGDETLSSSP